MIDPELLRALEKVSEYDSYPIGSQKIKLKMLFDLGLVKRDELGSWIPTSKGHCQLILWRRNEKAN